MDRGARPQNHGKSTFGLDPTYPRATSVAVKRRVAAASLLPCWANFSLLADAGCGPLRFRRALRILRRTPPNHWPYPCGVLR